MLKTIIIVIKLFLYSFISMSSEFYNYEFESIEGSKMPLKNYKGKSFLGDGGCYILSFTISLFIIDLYNQDNIKSDQIFLLMLIKNMILII